MSAITFKPLYIQRIWGGRKLETIYHRELPHPSATFGEARDPWTGAVRAAADAAYESTCPRGTPRQYEAYAAGLRVLRPLPKKSKPTTRKPAPATTDS